MRQLAQVFALARCRGRDVEPPALVRLDETRKHVLGMIDDGVGRWGHLPQPLRFVVRCGQDAVAVKQERWAPRGALVPGHRRERLSVGAPRPDRIVPKVGQRRETGQTRQRRLITKIGGAGSVFDGLLDEQTRQIRITIVRKSKCCEVSILCTKG